MQKKLIVAPSPFLRNTKASTRSIMLDVIIAMLPTAFAAVWYFGAPALSVMITCVLGCIISEWAYQKMTHQTSTIGDLSAVVTGLLLAFNMPASAPWWMGLIGSVIAIVLVKQMFGGIGQNFINPALAARTILMLSWTVLMAANVMPQAGQIFGLDMSEKAVTATPVAIVETTTEATGAATGEIAAVEATAEATGATTGEAAAPAEEAAPAVVAEATTEATGAATGEAAAPAEEAASAVVAEATTEATGAATGEAAAPAEEAAPAVVAEATTEATGAATGEAAAPAKEAAPAVVAEATTEATGAATGEAAAPAEEAAPAVVAEATTEATGAATGEAAAPAEKAAPVVVAEATTEATGAATGDATATVVATETTTEATAAATSAATTVETTSEATSAATTESASSATPAVEAVASATPTTVEATSVATPLSTNAKPDQYTLWDLFSGNIPGMLGETCKLTLLLGGLYLIFRRVIDWRIPLSFIATAFILFWIHTGVIYSPESGSQNALYQLFSGGLILGAFFMATDYVTSPVNKWGRVIMGVGCALILYVIRFFNAGYPEGCSFAILFMNVLTPLIDRYTARKPFGYTKPPKTEEKGAANA